MLVGSDTHYRFFSKATAATHWTVFSTIADRNDSIYKSALSDTLTLIKSNGQVFYFTFDKRIAEENK